MTLKYIDDTEVILFTESLTGFKDKLPSTTDEVKRQGHYNFLVFNFFLMHRDLQSNIDATVVPKIDVIMFIRCFTSGYHNQQPL